MTEHITATYLVETPHPLSEVTRQMASVLSTGTFTDVAGETDDLKARFRITVEDVRPLETVFAPSLPYWLPAGQTAQGVPHQRAEVTVSIPLDITGTDLPTLLSTVAGGVFEIREVSGVRLLTLDLPPAFAAAHPGPGFGVEGTRRLTGVYDRPILASIIKPNVGLTPEATADIVRELCEAGIDFVKDDEKMTNPAYAPIEQRIKAVMRVVNEHAERSAKRVMFAFNITDGDPEQMVRNHDAVLAAGGTCVMVSIVQVGLSGFQYLRKRAALPIHAHRNGWGGLTRAPLLGYDFRAWSAIWRLAGVDQLHVNGIQNKYWEEDDSVVASVNACLTPMFRPGDRILPVIGSGMHAGQVAETYRRTGTIDLMYICGGGIQGHPGGAAAGVASILQAWDAALAGIPLHVYAREHPALQQAIEKFRIPVTE